MTLRKKFKPYSSTQDVVLKGIPNVAADMLMRVIASRARVEGITEAEVVAQMSEREGRLAFNESYDRKVRAATTGDELLKGASEQRSAAPK